jgi:hypothetical protein
MCVLLISVGEQRRRRYRAQILLILESTSNDRRQFAR